MYRELGHFEEAVQACLLSGDSAKAEEIVNAAKDYLEPAQTKRLWLRIAEVVIHFSASKGKDGTKEALAVISRSNNALKLEDVISKLNDTTVIKDFKDAICTSLDAYTNSIADLKAEMKEATYTAKSIKEDIAALRHRYGYITTGQRCELCGTVTPSRGTGLFCISMLRARYA